ncbi:putative ribosomal N-acetyltransferase YdaF [Clostridium acetireducens DSM 10703]|uniref:Putative ribosomal N-acetyltransferase YdaF n=1 Tax=Clostridium acetireducens DSM 10703 TaxID=1121290 RepID=A0A1E8EYF5_9CLOT|nr:GNAT family protein [Clostridium acetireducens]OFI06000.1 putative ribosomal N-acetyltransferase YdaF [Clostridium acetireducens DSM 10703]
MKKLLEGKNIRLTAIEKQDINEFTKWYNNTEFMRYYDVISAAPKSSEDVLEMIEDVRKSTDKYIFAIRTIKNNKFIGVTGFENILWNNRNALIYIGIGNENYRGQGIGEEALYLTMEFGFEELNFNRIYLNVLEYNTKAISLYEKLGFIKEGTHREFIIRDGKKYDMYLYGILKHEWNNNKHIK